MTPGMRKLTLTAHITASVGWLGAVAGFEALAVTGLASQDALLVRAAYVVMERTAWFVIVPFALASLGTGLVISLGTKWGLLKHYWILAKLLINVLAIVLLLVHTKLIHLLARAAAENTIFMDELRGQRIQLVAVAGGALLALLVATTVAVYKPRGMTPYGRRKLSVREITRSKPLSRVRDNIASGGAGRRFGTVFLTAIGVVVLLAIVLHLVGGGHVSHSH
jgi:hypothetical protein